MSARPGWVATMMLALAAGVSAQQKPAETPSGKDSRKGNAPLTITGCVARGPGDNELTIDDLAGLLWAANLSTLELHPFLVPEPSAAALLAAGAAGLALTARRRRGAPRPS